MRAGPSGLESAVRLETDYENRQRLLGAAIKPQPFLFALNIADLFIPIFKPDFVVDPVLYFQADALIVNMPCPPNVFIGI